MEIAVIEVRELRKHYGEDGSIKAVDGVSFQCPDGQVTGLLGPNGAGKTTTLRLIAGLIRPLSGTVVVGGHDVTREPRAVRRVLGVQSDATGIYPRLSAREHLRYSGALHGLRGDELDQRVQAVVDELKMGEIADRRAAGFSRGQRQKIVLGRALVHDPPNVILDEPTSGLDVMAVRDTRQTMLAMKAQGRCVLFSTHYMDEAERLCDHIAIIVGGRLAACGSPAELLAHTGKDTLEEAFVALAGRGGLARTDDQPPGNGE